MGLHVGLATGSASAQVLGLGLKNTPYQTYRPPHRYWFPWMVAGGRSQAAGCGHPNEAWVLKLLVCKRPTIPARATERPHLAMETRAASHAFNTQGPCAVAATTLPGIIIHAVALAAP